MPSRPLNPEEQKWTQKSSIPCCHPEHNPPNMMVITEPIVWICPACGKETIILPPSKTCF